ncbi:MAG: hypothetical protein MUC81_06790 [Bacteroidia bacterium]|jgi:hypothetical protein|nr:hypothetical protein [Bacteroidia bacterium]
MKQLLTLSLFLSLGAFQVKAQIKDTLDYVMHNGNILPVLNKTTLDFSDLKELAKADPASFKAFKEVRRVRRAITTAEIISVVPLVWGLTSSERNFYIGLAISVAIPVTFETALTPKYNKKMHEFIKTYNAYIRSKRFN